MVCPYWAARPFAIGGRLVIGVLVCATAASAETQETTREFHLRLAWGGAAPRDWQAKLKFERANITEVQPLGIDSDVPGTFLPTPDGLITSTLRPQRYQAVDVTIRGSQSAELRVQLTTRSDPELQFSESFPLSSIERQPIRRELDDQGSRLLMRPAPGDPLRVHFVREHLVFAPRDRWQLDIEPRADLLASPGCRLTAELYRSQTNRSLWRAQTNLATPMPDAPGPRERLTVPIPDAEGAYDLMLRLEQKRSSPLPGIASLAERRVQFVVVDNRTASDTAGAEKTAWVDVSQRNLLLSWFDRSTSLPVWKPQELIRDRRLGTPPGTASADDVIRIEPAGWQAVTLSIDHPHRPHELEIITPTARPQSLGLAIVEAAADGRIQPRVPAAGFTTDELAGSWLDDEAAYRMLFWPRTRQPTFIVSNLRSQGPAVIHSIRVRQGPVSLPPQRPGPPLLGRRQALALFDNPEFLDMFSAEEALDPASGRSVTDWSTYLTAVQRLAQYLRHQNFDGASLGVLGDGGAIVPLPDLQSSCRFDSGPFAHDGRDPVRKDILELILRVFDREGLRCVPGIRFNSRIPQLEELLAANANADVAANDGLELVHRDGATWRARHGSTRGTGPFYNPVDPRVQQAMRQVVRAMMHRYGHHPSLAGIRVDLDPNSYALLHDIHWGYDAATLARFRRDYPDGPTLQPAGPHPDWVRWRTEQLGNLYRQFAAEIRAVRPEALLYLAGGRLADAIPMQRALLPGLPRQTSAMPVLAGMGLDLAALSRIDGIVLARPFVLPAADTLVTMGPYLEWQRDADVERGFSVPATLVDGRPYQKPLRVPAQGDESPPGEATHWMVAPVDSLATGSREYLARSLATADAQVLMLGGYRPSLGQLAAVRDFLAVFCELPRQPFETVSAERADAVTVRWLSAGDRSYVYLVNSAPWTVKCQTRWALPAGTRLLPITPSGQGTQQVADDDGLNWALEIPGYGVAAAVVGASEAPAMAIAEEHPPELSVALRAATSDVIARLARLRSLEPVSTFSNPGFEAVGPDQQVAGWELSHAEGVEFELDRQRVRSGSSSLRIRSTGPPAWVRSEAVHIPRTGRLSLHVRLRQSADTRAPLRLAVEGKFHGRPYYRYAEITPDTVEIDPDQWAPFVLQVTDLPDEGLTDLRVRFELRAAGEVWIDDVQLFDLAFTPPELNELLKIVSLADLQYSEGQLAACYHTLRQYWPRFLLEFAPPPPPRVARQPAHDMVPATSPSSEESRGLMDNVRKIVPWRR